MSGITLSASVRQNLLSLQSTASLLATTQNALATGNKVNSALDNPTSYFTAQSLNNRASDINNLLDQIGNGVQVLQAANTGITSLQSLVSNAQSIANQVLQAPTGYSTKSSVTSAAVTGATADNLLGTATLATAGTVTAGTFSTINVSATGAADQPATGAATISGTGFAAVDLSGSNSASFTLNVNGTSHSITLDTAAVTAFTTAGGTLSGTNGTSPTALTANDVAAIVNYQFAGAPSSITSNPTSPVTVVGGQLTIASATTGSTSETAITGYTHTGTVALGLPTTDTTNHGTNDIPAGANASESFTVALDGGTATTVTLSAAAVSTYNTAHSTAPQLNAASLSAANVATLVNSQLGSTVASVSTGGALVFTSATTGATSSVALSAVTTAGGATGSTGIVVTPTGSGVGTAANGGLSGQTLTIAATNSSLTATTITFGTTGTDISTLNGLNAALASNDLQASIDSTGAINITTTNNAASQQVGAISGTAVTATGAAFASVAAGGAAAVVDPNSQATRTSLVAQYNQVISNINTTAQDSSFNGINLLNGDTLNLTFDETGASKLSISGVTFNSTGLGLSTLGSTDFLDNNSANGVLTKLTQASTTLRTEASSLGSNLSVVQIRQDFNKNLINVLQTGASNLTLADTNEEAADSQALSTRQSIAVSALALANTSQQSVLQLLR